VSVICALTRLRRTTTTATTNPSYVVVGDWPICHGRRVNGARWGALNTT